ncbi:acyl-CoA carboxylase epsilon subunit [Streptomyces sp. TRM76323]|uniref:Acyl-CoA carboxylase epsilon subunit n=1 Tax=Streptomyces tamarix TaxID=3078565 RepID=A0ABU3QCG6_9ACTN|nr:acyl-CoA carboxylase epsilon subunit [Streptomyces tamarix]MDT9680475.1 acyl-CoA carboxylase epsilon subunit [Streptomyces tamarix]
MTTPLADASLLRVEKGHAAPEELAALTAVLLARAGARTAAAEAAPSHRARTTVGWRRPQWQSGFRAPHSWQG